MPGCRCSCPCRARSRSATRSRSLPAATSGSRPAATGSRTSSISEASRTCPATILRWVMPSRATTMTGNLLVVRRSDIIAEARSWIGTPYAHQASVKGIGCDCLGLVRGVWRAVYGEEPEQPPPYSRDWAEAHGRETLAEAAGRHMIAVATDKIRPADVLLFAMKENSPAKHCA